MGSRTVTRAALWTLIPGVLALSAIIVIVIFQSVIIAPPQPTIDTVIDTILHSSAPPGTFSELIDRIKMEYKPAPPPERGQGYGEEEFWRMPRQVRGNEPWTEKELKAGGVAQIHWLRGGSPDKVVRIYVIDVSGGGGCWGGGGPRGMYSFFVGANDELYGWYTDEILPPK